MDSFEVKRNLESGRGRLEIVNGNYMCYIDDSNTSNIRVGLVGEIRRGDNYSGVYEVDAVWNNSSAEMTVESEIKRLHGNFVEFTNLRSGPYRITKGQGGATLEDLAVVMAAYGSGYIDQCSLENRIMEEEQNRVRAEQNRMRQEQIRVRNTVFNASLEQIDLFFKRKDWHGYINGTLRMQNEFKDILRIKDPFSFNYNLGYAFAQVGEPKNALRWYKKAFKFNKKPNLYYTIAQIYEDLNVNKAIKWYKSGMKFKDNSKYNKWAINKVASLYLRKINEAWGKQRKVIKYFDQLAKFLQIKRLDLPVLGLRRLLEEGTDKKKSVLYSIARGYSKGGYPEKGAKFYKMFVDELGIK